MRQQLDPPTLVLVLALLPRLYRAPDAANTSVFVWAFFALDSQLRWLLRI
jgi:hypothetical protein